MEIFLLYKFGFFKSPSELLRNFSPFRLEILSQTNFFHFHSFLKIWSPLPSFCTKKKVQQSECQDVGHGLESASFGCVYFSTVPVTVVLIRAVHEFNVDEELTEALLEARRGANGNRKIHKVFLYIFLNTTSSYLLFFITSRSLTLPHTLQVI